MEVGGGEGGGGALVTDSRRGRDLQQMQIPAACMVREREGGEGSGQVRKIFLFADFSYRSTIAPWSP